MLEKQSALSLSAASSLAESPPTGALFTGGRAAMWPSLVWAALLGCSFHWIEPTFFYFGHLEAAFYEHGSIVGHAVRHSRPFAITAGLLVVFALWQFRLTWTQLGPLGARLRYPALAIIGSLSWLLTTAEANFWWGYAYWPERCLLGLLGALAAFRPAFLGAFVLMALMLTGQFNEPFLFSWTDKLVIYHLGLVIFLFVVAHVLSFGRATANSAFMVMLAVLGGWYLFPAFGKLQIGWLTENNISHLVSSAFYQNGWLSWLGQDSFEAVRQWTDSLSAGLMLTALCIEMSVVTWLFTRRLTYVALAACTLLHMGIFVSSGIFFWKWIVIEIAFMLGLRNLPPPQERQLFGWRQGLATCCLMLLIGYYSPRVVNLAWYDEPCAYRFRFEATGESGQHYELIAADFAPYDLPFAQARFYFLTQRQQLVGTLGTTQLPQVHEFFKLAWDEQRSRVEQVVTEHGQPQYNVGLAQHMERFLTRYVGTTHQPQPAYQRWLEPLRLLAAPQHIHTAQLTAPTMPRYRHQEALQGISVYLDEYLLNGPTTALVHHEHLLTASPVRLAQGEVAVEIH